MNNIVYGFNINIDHIGWTVLDKCKEMILDYGVREFQVPENPKEKTSLAAERRLALSGMRTTRRKRTRLKQVRELIVQNKLLSRVELNNLFNSREPREELFLLRAKGLDYCLSNKEWARVLIYLARHRSYVSNSKEERLKEQLISNQESDSKVSKDDETGKVLKALRENEQLFIESNYRTIGELIAKHEKFAQKKRNFPGDYNRTFHRKFIVDEIKTLFSAQRALGNKFATEDFEKKYLDIVLFQKPYTTRELLERQAGECTLIKGEMRYPKNTYSFERFFLLQKINSLKVNDISLTEEQRNSIIDLVYKQKSVTFARIRKELGLLEDDRFNYLNYGLNDVKKVEKAEFFSAKFYHAIKKALTEHSPSLWEEVSHDVDVFDYIGYGLSTCKYDDELVEFLEPHMNKEIIEAVKLLDFSGFGHISKKAIDMLMPYLEDGDVYTIACMNAQLDYRGHSIGTKVFDKLPVFSGNEINNPRLHRVIAEFRKIFNSLIDRYGVPLDVNITIDKELSMSGKDRNKLLRENKKYQDSFEKTKDEFFHEFMINGTVTEINKYILWKEQKGIDVYTGEEIPLKELLTPKYVIDSIIDERLILQNSMANKVLTSKENANKKGIKTVYEFMDEDEDKYSELLNRLKDYDGNEYKKMLLLKRKISKSNLKTWYEKRTSDNRQNSSLIYNLISLNTTAKVTLYSSSWVNFLRKEWRISKDSDKLYSRYIDSMILATLSNDYMQKIQEISKNILSKEKKVVGEAFPMPYEYFADEVRAYVSNNRKVNLRLLTDEYKLGDRYSYTFIEKMKNFYPSIKCNHSVNGQIHPATIRPKKYTKTPLTKLNFSNIGYNPKTKEFDCKIFNYGSDSATYDAILDRLIEFDGNGAKAFEEPFYKLSKSGVPGQEIKGVKLINSYNGVEVNGGITSSAMQLRIDIFNSKGKLWIVPIYRHNVHTELPNTAISQKEVVVSDDEFLFSLYNQDTILFKENGEDILGIYKGVDRSSGAMSIKVLRNGAFEDCRVTINRLEDLRKINIGILGDYNIIKKEKRQYFKKKGQKK